MTNRSLDAVAKVCLRLVVDSSIWFPTRGGRDERRDAFVDLVARGLVTSRLSSIGEASEKIHFTITDAGRKAFANVVEKVT